MFGSVGHWFYQSLAGIRQAPNSAVRRLSDHLPPPETAILLDLGCLQGWTEIVIQPPSSAVLASAPLSSVSGEIYTLKGYLESSWAVSGGSQCARAHEGSALEVRRQQEREREKRKTKSF